MDIVSMLLVVQRRATGVVAGLAFLAGTLFWGPLGALWVAVLIMGTLCLASGAFLHEFDLRYKANHLVTGLLTDREAQAVKVSGIGYLCVGLVSGWFGATVVLIGCLAAVADYISGHRLALRFAQADLTPVA